MTSILEQFKTAIESLGNDEVYTAFDALPVRTKARSFTVVGIRSYEASAPVFSPTIIFLPFKAEVEINVYARESEPMTALYTYFETYVRPAIDAVSGTTGRLCRLSMKHDSNLRRLVLTAGVSVSGIRRIERAEP
jgi:hypothetical protein